MTVHEVEQEIRDTGDALAQATAEEMRLEDGRAGEKMNAMLRLMQTENPITGKVYGATAANDFIEQDADYRAYRERQRLAVVARIVAKARYEAALAKARLAEYVQVAA